jgi:hypothetical protein
MQDLLEQVSPETKYIVDYICDSCHEGCAVISESRLEIKNFFTSGKRPEIKKEAKRLFGWLTGKELQFLSERARQKFTHRGDADHYRYSLFLYIIELWRPFSSAADALRDAYIPPTRTAYSGIISTALTLAQTAVYELRPDLRESGKPDVANVKITKFKKQSGRRHSPYLSHDYVGILEQLRHIFMSKVEQMKSVALSADIANSNIHKRKLDDVDNFEGDDLRRMHP